MTDETGASSAQAVTVTIQGTNDDVDLSDTHTAAFVAAASNTTALGIFALDGVINATAAGSVGWTYTLNNAAAQFLSADETRTEVFTVTVTDETGASSAQAVTITIQGTRSAISPTSAPLRSAMLI